MNLCSLTEKRGRPLLLERHHNNFSRLTTKTRNGHHQSGKPALKGTSGQNNHRTSPTTPTNKKRPRAVYKGSRLHPTTEKKDYNCANHKEKIAQQGKRVGCDMFHGKNSRATKAEGSQRGLPLKQNPSQSKHFIHNSSDTTIVGNGEGIWSKANYLKEGKNCPNVTSPPRSKTRQRTQTRPRGGSAARNESHER